MTLRMEMQIVGYATPVVKCTVNFSSVLGRLLQVDLITLEGV